MVAKPLVKVPGRPGDRLGSAKLFSPPPVAPTAVGRRTSRDVPTIKNHGLGFFGRCAGHRAGRRVWWLAGIPGEKFCLRRAVAIPI